MSILHFPEINDCPPAPCSTDFDEDYKISTQLYQKLQQQKSPTVSHILP